MWLEFAASTVALTFYLFAPGYILLRGFGLPRQIGVSCAPLIGVFVSVALGIAYAGFGMSVSIAWILIPYLLLAVTIYVLHIFSKKKYAKSENRLSSKLRAADCKLVICFVASITACFLTTSYLFYRGLPAADSYIQLYDNALHINVVKSMAESGKFSILAVEVHMEPSSSLFNPYSPAGFYPAAFHVLAALVAQSFGVSAPLAVNAVCFVFIGIVLPTGFFVFFSYATNRSYKMLLAGSLASVAFVAFPWRMLYWGPLYPNLAGYSLVFSVSAIFIYLLSKGLSLPERVTASSIFVACLVSVAALHPNAAFVVGILVAPYCVYRIATSHYGKLVEKVGVSNRCLRLILVALFLVFVAFVWAIFFNSGFMQGIIWYSDWRASGGVTDAIAQISSLSLSLDPPQLLLALLVFVGVVFTLFDRRFLWMTAAFLVSAVLYAVDVTSDGFLRHLLTGFWYTDPYRIAGMVALYAMPLAGLGIYVVAHSLCGMCANLVAISGRQMGGRDTFARAVPFTLIVFALYGVVIWPYGQTSALDETKAFGKMESALGYMYSIDRDVNNNLTRAESDFIDEVKSVVSADDVILNNPYDGSVFTYAVDGLNLVYRKFGGIGLGESEHSKLLRSKMNSFSEDNRVYIAAKEMGIDYVLVLDQGAQGREGRDIPGYDVNDWSGIQRITDETEGFEVVLSRDDMRLYRVCY